LIWFGGNDFSLPWIFRLQLRFLIGELRYRKHLRPFISDNQKDCSSYSFGPSLQIGSYYGLY